LITFSVFLFPLGKKSFSFIYVAVSQHFLTARYSKTKAENFCLKRIAHYKKIRGPLEGARVTDRIKNADLKYM